MVFIFFFAQKPPPAPRSTSEVGGFALGDEKPAATQTLWFGQAFGLVCVAQTIARSSFLHLLAHVDPLLLTRLRKHQLHFKSLPGPRSLEVYIGGCLNGFLQRAVYIKTEGYKGYFEILQSVLGVPHGPVPG